MNQIQIPSKILNAFKKKATYYAFYGGRGGAKSESIGRILLIEGMKNKHKIVCCRETMASIEDSVFSLLKGIIAKYDIKGYVCTKNKIRQSNGTEFVFKGLKKETVGSIKSIPNITICWVEEAQFVSRQSLDTLIPTIREDDSVVVFTLNPDLESDPVYADYIAVERPDTVKCKINYTENPFVTGKIKADANYCRENDIEKYNNVWLGETKTISEAVIFKSRYIVESFEMLPTYDYMYGADFGDADPNTLVKCFIKDNCLYIADEMYEVGQKLEDMAKGYLKIINNNSDYVNGDNVRSETIKYLQRQGINIRGENKLQIEDGIAFIKNFRKIIIHPRCVNTIFEFSKYSRVIDSKTGLVTEKLIDKHNHCIDAIRYALKKKIEQSVEKGYKSFSSNLTF